jgi:hypothetical protein
LVADSTRFNGRTSLSESARAASATSAATDFLAQTSVKI